MKKTIVILCGLVLAFAIAGTATAREITVTLDEYCSNDFLTYVFFQQNDSKYYSVGSFSYGEELAGQIVTSATISGSWGLDPSTSTADNTLFLDGHEIVSASATSNSGAWGPYDFIYLTDLDDGVANLYTQQTWIGMVNLGETTLTIETAPVPEPCTMLLVAGGLLGLAGFRRKTRT
jgi:hypothetical protein